MKTKHETMNAPTMNPDGSCPKCLFAGGWHCEWHQAEAVRRCRERSAMAARVCRRATDEDIARTCARYELESDEFQTREEKAERILRSESARAGR